MSLCVLALTAAIVPYSAAFAASMITARPDDPAAVYVTPQESGVRGDGMNDDSGGIQAAIDKAASSFGGGIVFLPAGRYRLTRTAPGYQKGIGLMVLFSAGRPAGAGGRGGRGRMPFPPPGTVPPNENIADANHGTFYSSMMNIDFEIGSGNPAAVAIRFHVAQHGVLRHMDFHVGSGLAALMEIGKMRTTSTSPAAATAS